MKDFAKKWDHMATGTLASSAFWSSCLTTAKLGPPPEGGVSLAGVSGGEADLAGETIDGTTWAVVALPTKGGVPGRPCFEDLSEAGSRLSRARLRLNLPRKISDSRESAPN